MDEILKDEAVVEAMAFQILLHKVTALERDVHSMIPLLAKIIDHLEAQGKQPEVPVASYAELYPMLVAEEHEGEVIAAQPHALPIPVPRPWKANLWHWFLKEAR